jgi:hypothetical protein
MAPWSTPLSDGLVTAARREEQGHQGYGRMRERLPRFTSDREERGEEVRCRCRDIESQSIYSITPRQYNSRHTFAPRGAMRPGFAGNSSPSRQRAWGMPGARCTRSLVCAWVLENAHEYSQRSHRNRPAFPHAMVLRLIPRSPRRSALLPPSPCGLKVLFRPVGPNEPPQDLTPASRRQDHTTSPSASSVVVLRAANRSRRAIRPALRIARLTLPRPSHPIPRS